MDYKEILTISGKSGLFKLISQSKSSAVVESLTEHNRMPLFMSSKASSLEEIYLYTEEGSIALKDVFQRIYAHTKGEKTIDTKTAEPEMRSYLETIIPEYDRDRVHYSDMKRLFSWYNILLENNLLVLGEEEKPEEAGQSAK